MGRSGRRQQRMSLHSSRRVENFLSLQTNEIGKAIYVSICIYAIALQLSSTGHHEVSCNTGWAHPEWGRCLKSALR